MSSRNFASNIIGAAVGATVSFLALPLLLLVLTSNDPSRLKVAEAFVTPGGGNGVTRSFNVRTQSETFSHLGLLSGSKMNSPITAPRPVSFHLYSIQQQYEEQQQHKSDQDEDSDDEKENSEAKRLLRDAERLRLEAEQMDATLTLQKIANLEEKLSNDDWLKKQQGQTVKDLYEELRMLEMKVSRPNSSVRSTDIMIPKQQEESLSSKVQPPQTSSYSKSSSDRYKNDNKRTNPNLPPLAGFDDKDLNLYVPIAEDVNKMAPNMTLNQRIGLFRDAPELQAHFKEKIQNLLLGPLEEMQELETLKQQYFESTSSREKESLLKEIKRLEAKMDDQDIGMNGNGGVNDPGGVGYSKSILLSPDKLPPLTEDELKERYDAIKALPDILVAVYLQRIGLYDLPVAFSTIKLEVGSGGIGVNMNTVNNSATNANDEDDTQEIESNGSIEGDEEQAGTKDDRPFDLFENLELAIELDYYDLQLQLLNQALAIRPMPEEVRKDYAAAFRSLPLRVRERYVTNSLGIDTIDASVLASDEEKDVECVLEEILKPLDEEFSLGSFINLNGKSKEEGKEQPIEPPEYNDVEFIDRSRYLEEFFPTVAQLEDARPLPEEVDLFVTDCLSGPGNKPFMVTSKPERVIGGYYIRGTNQLGFDENSSVSANDRLIQEVSKRLENHPTLKDKIEFYYILDPSPPTDEEMELEVGLNPLFLITAKDPKTMYGLSSPLTKTAITISGFLSTFLFSVGSCVLNPRVNANIQSTLDNVSSTGSTTTFIDVTWFYQLTLPLFFSFMSIFIAHELGHRIVAFNYKFDIGLPNVLPSATTGLAGAITPIKSPPPNNKALFDFAIAGPLAGLTVSIGLLFVGLALTREIGMDANLPVLPVELARSSSLGGGMIQYFMGKYALLPDQGPEAYVELHPFAISGWIGCIINALALLPLGHTDGGRIALTMFGRRGAFVTKLFTTLILVLAGLVGFDNMNILLAYAIFVLVWQRELDSPIRNEVDELDFSRGLLGITSAILVGLVLIPMTS
eukprot:CAMPEP_0116098228 /NCGR_PEP_ID=MMETSP0327-20121206/11114_1 /TAXON_ID=44447 /ORGANISM="Pseudo-nitzschia delicatissima, Strain B596" /LENGTH=1023 /DNA_ID=CAMNT_0003590007 /DNA_START=149 /DNA_END=3220 /DNA_ORIENTATION=-